jgi:hypothetical protein
MLILVSSRLKLKLKTRRLSINTVLRDLLPPPRLHPEPAREPEKLVVPKNGNFPETGIFKKPPDFFQFSWTFIFVCFASLLLDVASSSVCRDVGPSVRLSVTKEETSGFRVHFKGTF